MAKAPSKRRKINVCGIRVPAADIASHGGGKYVPGARDISSTAYVSKATAKKLAARVPTDYGSSGRRPPRPGYEMLLCADTWLENNAGYFHVKLQRSGGFGRARRKKGR